MAVVDHTQTSPAWIDDFPDLDGTHYLNVGTLALVPSPVMQRYLAYFEEWNRLGAGDPLHYQGWRERVECTRTSLAEYCGISSADSLHLTSSVSDALNLAIFGWQIAPGAAVITSDQEHPALVAPLTHLYQTGHPISVIAYGSGGDAFLDRLQRALEQSPTPVGMVAVSHVSHMTGALIDAQAVAALCDHFGARLLLDGAQAFGQVPMKPGLAADAYVLNGQKWGLAPVGNAALYVRPDRLPTWNPPLHGPSDGFWTHYPQSLEGGWTAHRRRLEYGTRSWPTWMAWCDALAYRASWPPLTFEHHASALARALKQALVRRSRITLFSRLDTPTATVSFAVEGINNQQLSDHLRKFRIVHRIIGAPLHAVRLTFGPSNRADALTQVAAALDALQGTETGGQEK